MFQAQIGKRLSPRYSQPLIRVVALISEALLQVDAGGKPVLFPRTTINQTLVSTDCNKFDYSILSLTACDFSAHFTTGFITKLYNKLKLKQIRNALLRHQICYALDLEAVSALIF
ncbi:MAG: hypothetical protein ACR2MG_10905 [Pyrinomonadaceae bacterium]